MSIPFIGVVSLLLAWVGFFGLSRELAARKRIYSDWRVSWLLASAAWGALLTFVVEGSSAMQQLNGATLFVVWAVLSTILAGTALAFARKRRALSRAACAQWWKGVIEDWTHLWALDAKLMLVASAALILVLGVMAAVFPSTNWDSVTYHLPRVMHWIQQQSVEHYPTHNTRQIEFAPWSGFVLTQLHLLFGSDQLDNLVQWFAMLTCVIVTSFIAQELLGWSVTAAKSETDPGALRTKALLLRRTSALSCLLVATLPTGIVESITTQTDYVVACWFTGLTCLLIALWREPANVWYALGAGLTLALGTVTKATMLIYSAPLGIAFVAWWVVRLGDHRLRIRLASIFIACLLMLNAPHWMRNYAIFGSPLASRQVLSIERSGTLSVGGTISTVIRNLTLQTNTGIKPLTDEINQLLMRLHRFTGKDVSDPETTYYLGAFELPEQFIIKDSYSSNFYHLLLILTATVVLARRPKKNRIWFAYGSMALAGFILFCTLLRWQLWHSRVHLAWFVVLMPWGAAILTSKMPRWVVRVAAPGFFLFAGYCLVNNESRSLLDLDAKAFSREFPLLSLRGTWLNEPLAMAAHDIVVSHCDQVGIKMDFDDPEYPVWVMLRNRGFTGRIDDFAVDNESGRIARAAAHPCAVLATSRTLPAGITNWSQFQSQYGLIRVFWSKSASRWAELAEVNAAARTDRWLPREGARVRLEGQYLRFGLRTAREGRLHLTGSILDTTGHPLAKGTLRVSTESGFEQTLALNGQPISLVVPSRGGSHLVQIDLSDSQNAPDPVWEQFGWSWEPGETK